MNLVLFDTAAEARLLTPADPRARHIREVLRMIPGNTLFVGVVNGPRGKATIAQDGPEGMLLDVQWETVVEKPRPFFVLAGLCRPQTARDLLREAATFGVASLHFFGPEKGESSYASSTLWTSNEWKQRLHEGAAQAFATTIPEVRHAKSLSEALETGSKFFPSEAARIALDVYEGSAPLSSLTPTAGPVVLALGSERGWSAKERDVLRNTGFALGHLGPRVLRTETALVAALSVILARHGEF